MTSKVLFLVLALAIPSLCAQNIRQGGIPDHIYEPPVVLDEEEGVAALEDFRNQRLAGDFSFLFELRHMPRRGSTVKYPGQIIGTWQSGYPVFRVDIYPSGQFGEGSRISLLLVNDGKGRAWRYDSSSESEIDNSESEVRLLQDEQIYQPFIPGMVYTAFDLLMPYVYWSDYDYLGKQRVKSRNVHSYFMHPPEKVSIDCPEMKSVKMQVDAEFNALIKAQVIGNDDDVLKTFKVNSFKKVSDQYIVKEIDLLNESSRDKTRFIVLEAALDQAFSASVFLPEAISEPVPHLEEASYVKTD